MSDPVSDDAPIVHTIEDQDVVDQAQALLMGLHIANKNWLDDMPAGRRNTVIGFAAFATAGLVFAARAVEALQPYLEANPDMMDWVNSMATTILDALGPIRGKTQPVAEQQQQKKVKFDA